MYLIGLLLPTLVLLLLGCGLVSSGRDRRAARSWTPPPSPAPRRRPAPVAPAAVAPAAAWGASAADPRPIPVAPRERPAASTTPVAPPSSGGTVRLVVGVVVLVLAALSGLNAVGQVSRPDPAVPTYPSSSTTR